MAGQFPVVQTGVDDGFTAILAGGADRGCKIDADPTTALSGIEGALVLVPVPMHPDVAFAWSIPPQIAVKAAGGGIGQSGIPAGDLAVPSMPQDSLKQDTARPSWSPDWKVPQLAIDSPNEGDCANAESALPDEANIELVPRPQADLTVLPTAASLLPVTDLATDQGIGANLGHIKAPAPKSGALETPQIEGDAQPAPVGNVAVAGVQNSGPLRQESGERVQKGANGDRIAGPDAIAPSGKRSPEAALRRDLLFLDGAQTIETDGPLALDDGPGLALARQGPSGFSAEASSVATTEVSAGGPSSSAAESLWRGVALVWSAAPQALQDGAANIPVVETAGPQSAALAGPPLPSLAKPVPGLWDQSFAEPAPHIAVSDPYGPHHAPVPASPRGWSVETLPVSGAGAIASSPASLSLTVEGEVPPESLLAASSGWTVGPGLPVPLNGPSLSAIPQAHAAMAHLSSHMAAALSQHPDGATDIALSPEELGRVRITLQSDAQNPDRMVIFLSFDRPETMELFRRHADQLAEAMRTAGYAGADINFGQSGSGGFGPGSEGSATMPAAGSAAPGAASDNPLPDAVTGSSSPKSPRPGATTALDLRL